MDNIDKLTDRLVDISNKLEATIGAKGPAMVEAYVSAVWADALAGVTAGLVLAAICFPIWRLIESSHASYRKDRLGAGDLGVGIGGLGLVLCGGASLALVFSNIAPLVNPTGFALKRLIGG